jgi:ribose 5-phosphate isomerase B
MIGEEELRALARRIAGSVLAERGRREYTTALPALLTDSRAPGVHVDVRRDGDPLRPRVPVPSTSGRDDHLVSAESLRGVKDGGRLVIPRGARVTALARDEAWRRKIALVDGEHARPDVRREDGRLRIAVGADHGGLAMKREIVGWLREAQHVVFDLGTHDENAVDYPDFARAVAESVAQDRADVGICVDGAGIGSAMAANKVPGVRAANCWDVPSAKNAREHNFANVLTLGGKSLLLANARAVVDAFLATAWGEARHARRIDKITAIERVYTRSAALGEKA